MWVPRGHAASARPGSPTAGLAPPPLSPGPPAAAAAAAAAGTDGQASWTGGAGARVVTHAAAGVRAPAEHCPSVRVRRGGSGCFPTARG